jgi:hypothetical protein
MARVKNIFHKQTLIGEKTTVGQISLTPQSQALMIRWPYGGVVWNRPLAVLVERDGQIERIRIMNVTRMTQFGLLGLTLIFCIIILLMQQGVLSVVEKGRKDE